MLFKKYWRGVTTSREKDKRKILNKRMNTVMQGVNKQLHEGMKKNRKRIRRRERGQKGERGRK